jgi:acetoin utilization deacetylase AcuC-like enzyme
MRVTPGGFAALTRILLTIADSCCRGRLVAVLEGGYHILGLTKSVKAVLEEMLDETHFSKEKLSSLEKEADDETNQVIKQVIARINPYWKVF